MKNVDDVVKLLRKDIRSLKPYVSARSGHQQSSSDILLNANENPYTPHGFEHTNYNRYPEPQSEALRSKLSSIWGTMSENLLLTRGSDEAIDLICRAFCESEKDAVIVQPPTFEIYRLAAQLQKAEVIEDTSCDLENTLLQLENNPHTKLIFICSPNNPTGYVHDRKDLLRFIEAVAARAVVVVDEAYVEFSEKESLVSTVTTYPWLLVLRTLSKAWGLAGVRLGGMIANNTLVQEIRKIQQVYPTPKPVEDVVMKVLTPMGIALIKDRINKLNSERTRLQNILQQLDGVEKVENSGGNFLLLRLIDRAKILARLQEAGIVVRDRNSLIENTIRLSVGTRAENDLLLKVMGWKEPLCEREALLKTRESYQVRNTRETKIEMYINLDKNCEYSIDTGIGFFDHMLEQMPLHGDFCLRVKCKGDLHVDAHHLVEDCAIVLGQCFLDALGDKRGIGRYGFVVAMDESRTGMTMDLSGRGVYLEEGSYPDVDLGQYPALLTSHFLRSFSENLKCALQVEVRGEDAHHKVESTFKALGRVLGMACGKLNYKGLPSSKGML